MRMRNVEKMKMTSGKCGTVRRKARRGSRTSRDLRETPALAIAMFGKPRD